MQEINREQAPYREKIDELYGILKEHGGLGAILVDMSPISRVEASYGVAAFQDVLGSTTELILELRGKEVRGSDIFASCERGEGLLIFLSPPEQGGAPRLSELESIATRIETHLNGRLIELASPYLHESTRVNVGYGLVLQNPLVMPERLVARLVQEAWECVRLAGQKRRFEDRCLLQELLIHGEISTVYQPIIDMTDGAAVGFEALTRGPIGSAFHRPVDLFRTAADSNLVFELDRLCRRKALWNASKFPSTAKLFVNVMPSAIYDPALSGDGLVRILNEVGLEPEQLVLELTENYVIENYSLFSDAIANFTKLGVSIGIDDIGAGHSGLERIANLHPRYLKFDIALIRKLDQSYVRREMVKAMKTLADKMGSTVIAEGIERKEELQTLLDLGIVFGQGFLLGRPAEPSQAWREKKMLREPKSSYEITLDIKQ